MNMSDTVAIAKRITDNLLPAALCSIPLYSELCDANVDAEARANMADSIHQFQMYLVEDLLFASRVRYERFLAAISHRGMRIKAVAIRRLWSL